MDNHTQRIDTAAIRALADAGYDGPLSSDELIAAIQQRWPDYGICITTCGGIVRVRYNSQSGWESRTVKARTFDGPTMLQALAALYLALAGGE